VPLASRRVSDNRALSLIGLCILTWIKERDEIRQWDYALRLMAKGAVLQ
jgi:hypothetical protein